MSDDRYFRLCLTKLPSLDVSWSDPVKDAWFRCFQHIMDRTVEARSGPPNRSEPNDPKETPMNIEGGAKP